MIYDCFLYNGEQDLLKIARNELLELDVSHVLVQSDKTFTGNENKLDYDLPEDICGVGDKFLFVVVTVRDMPNEKDPWVLERFQRNAIMRALKEAKDDDVIIIRDCDEVPSAEAIKQYNPDMGLTALVMDKFGYFLNCMEGRQSWKSARIMPYSYLKDRSPDEVRNSGYQNEIQNAGWHWSYCGGVEAIMNKLSSFSHQECNTPELNNREVLEHKLYTGQSLWSNKEDDLWEFVPIDNTFPEYVQDRQHDTLKHLIKQI
jgi:beta-1,4-mannosyl-glycoprotein beta-1,4-N-acetylglucosaminyltransferase